MHFTVHASESVRDMPPAGRFPARRVDHYTLVAENGQAVLATAFVDPASARVGPGQTVDGELTGPDSVDQVRQKFRFAAPAAPAGTAGPPPLPPAPRPNFPDPNVGRRIERQHSQEMALRYIEVVARLRGVSPALTLVDVAAITSAFEDDLNLPSPPAVDLLTADSPQATSAGTRAPTAPAQSPLPSTPPAPAGAGANAEPSYAQW